MNKLSYLLIITGIVSSISLQAKESPGLPSRARRHLQHKAEGCHPAGYQADLDINNVRARIMNGGDMWWDLNAVAKYEVPKVSEAGAIKRNSMFAGAIWVAGLAKSGNLKVAAMTYRYEGSDYFPGPLNTSTGLTNADRCKFYDRIYKINKTDLIAYRNDPSKATEDIRNYPGTGDPVYGEANFLAPYFDGDASHSYSADGMDYPILDPTRPDEDNEPEDQPDQMLVFIYNDKGNIHGETGGLPIGLEMVTTAFAFQANDEINNMTFYKTKIVNRSSEEIHDCYFGQWVDADLGNYKDDYVGCDTTRDLGFCYNGDENDEGILGYGLNPPSVGTDFFQGPLNEKGVELGLSAFVYYDNNLSVIGNPQIAEHYYNYLRAKWKDGTDVTYGGNGRNGTMATKFMFPGDPTKPAEWHEKSAGNPPDDRRYIQSSGPFILKAGAVNYVTVGVVWARTTSGGATGSLNLLKLASDKAQKLFNNKFKLLTGPDAPTVDVQELHQEVVLNFLETNTKRVEKYRDTVRGVGSNLLDYRFQGYLIYQLKNAEVTQADLTNIDKARLVAQCDIKDNVVQLINREFDPKVQDYYKIEKVNGNNAGVIHSFSIKEDLFASGNKDLVNFKTYYYMVISYANCTNDVTEDLQFLAGNSNVKRYAAIPHKPDPRAGGTQLKGGYGSGPSITRLSGNGNGGNILELTQESIDQIMSGPPYRIENPVYLGGFGPVKVKVIDPFKVPRAKFELKFVDSLATADSTILRPARTWWSLTNMSDNSVVWSDTTINIQNEKIISQWGISVSITQVVGPGTPFDSTDADNGYIESSMEFSDPSKTWLTAMPDQDITTGFYAFLNWIRSGENGRTSFRTAYNRMEYEHDFAVGTALDPFEKWENLLDRRIAPYQLSSRAPYNPATGEVTYGPASREMGVGDVSLSNLASIDLVITPDKNKWTRCVVLEMGEDPALTIGNAVKHRPRKSASLNKNFEPDGSGTGQSWFPGYAINLETGERLNLMFGEDSHLISENGADMIWNPTSNFYTRTDVAIGGKHYIYIMGRVDYGANDWTGSTDPRVGPGYDGGDAYMAKFATDNINARKQIHNQCLYVMPSYMATGYEMKNGIPLTEVHIRIRVKKPYVAYKYDNSSPTVNNNLPFYSFDLEDVAPDHSNQIAKNAIDLIKMVPNPYYGYSTYENSPLDNRVKITNLPDKATIKIFTLNGALVRTIKKDDGEQTYADWDLKNSSNVPVASGMYIIHVDVPGVGTKILKWFGIMREIDLDSF